MVDFSGASQYLSLPVNSAMLQNITAVSYSGWLNQDSAPALGTNQNPFCLSINGGTDSRFQMQNRNIAGVQNYNITSRPLDTDGAIFSEGTGVPAIGTYHNLQGSSDYGPNVQNIHVNGAQIVSGSPAMTSPGSNTTSDVGYIGRNETAANSENYDGKIEDVRIYTRSLSADEKRTIFACHGTDGIILGLKSRWMLNDLASGAVGASAAKDRGPLGAHLSGTGATFTGGSGLKWRRRVL